MHPTIIVIIVELFIVLIILRILTGKKGLVQKSYHGLIRLIGGGFSALVAYAIWTYCVQKYGRMCVGALMAGTFFAFLVLAICLIPIGVIQTIWILLKRPSDKVEN